MRIEGHKSKLTKGMPPSCRLPIVGAGITSSTLRNRSEDATRTEIRGRPLGRIGRFFHFPG